MPLRALSPSPRGFPFLFHRLSQPIRAIFCTLCSVHRSPNNGLPPYRFVVHGSSRTGVSGTVSEGFLGMSTDGIEPEFESYITKSLFVALPHKHHPHLRTHTALFTFCCCTSLPLSLSRAAPHPGPAPPLAVFIYRVVLRSHLRVAIARERERFGNWQLYSAAAALTPHTTHENASQVQQYYSSTCTGLLEKGEWKTRVACHVLSCNNYCSTYTQHGAAGRCTCRNNAVCAVCVLPRFLPCRAVARCNTPLFLKTTALCIDIQYI